jgi:GH18 family chitinase
MPLLVVAVAALLPPVVSPSTMPRKYLPGSSLPRSSPKAVTNATHRNIRHRSCDKVWPNQINTTGLTHLILSSAAIDPKTFEIHLMHPSDEDTYKQFLALPDTVAKWISLGFGQTDCDCSDPAVARHNWATMSSSPENRGAFVKSLSQFLQKWHFKGVHIDWEWSHAMNRGGNDQANKQDLVDTIALVRQSFGQDTGLSASLPAQNETLSHMDLQGLQAHVDWFDAVTYDLHGPWDSSDTRYGPYIKPHTDVAEIDKALGLYWSAGVTPNKVNLGVSNYGRGYTVANTTCAWYGCKFTRGSTAGACTKTEGVLSACEIRRIIAEKKLTPKFIDGGAGVKEISWDDQWVGYDDQDTFDLKLSFANDHCLGGTALWAIDRQICDGRYVIADFLIMLPLTAAHSLDHLWDGTLLV